MSGIINFVKESYEEMTTKVTWPSWKELQSSSILVMVASVIIASVVFLMDYIFGINSATALWKGVLGWIYYLI
jgi:preprotein translocase subunit SecE